MNRDLYRIVSWQKLRQSRLVMGDTFAIIFQFRSAFEMQILSSGKKLFQMRSQNHKKMFHNLSTNHVCTCSIHVCICVCAPMCVCI